MFSSIAKMFTSSFLAIVAMFGGHVQEDVPVPVVEQRVSMPTPDKITVPPPVSEKLKSNSEGSTTNTRGAEKNAATVTKQKTTLASSNDPVFVFSDYYGRIDAYDYMNRHTGYAKQTYGGQTFDIIEEGIPGSYYMSFGSNESIFYPRGVNGKIVITGATTTAYADLEIRSDNRTIGTYKNINIRPGSVGTLPVVYNGDNVDIGPLQVDYDNDKIIDQTINGESQ